MADLKPLIAKAAIATGHGDEDICSTIKVLEGMCGVEVKKRDA